MSELGITGHREGERYKSMEKLCFAFQRSIYAYTSPLGRGQEQESREDLEEFSFSVLPDRLWRAGCRLLSEICCERHGRFTALCVSCNELQWG